MVPGLPAGEVAEVRSPAWLARRPFHHVRVGVDVAGVVAEKDEANNEYTRRFRVRLRAARTGG
jgi:subtilase family serine protease